MKTHYRTFNIKSEELTPGDDYGMMREVLQRRFTRLMKEAPRTEQETGHAAEGGAQEPAPARPTRRGLPGLAGPRADRRRQGPARRGAGGARRARRRSVPLVGVAKGPDRDAGRETFFVPGRPAFKLAPRDPALYFVQRLRDEAHRFAIGTHRAKRKREMPKSPLDEIAGIGPSRKRALLHHFGTVKAIERAALRRSGQDARASTPRRRGRSTTSSMRGA